MQRTVAMWHCGPQVLMCALWTTVRWAVRWAHVYSGLVLVLQCLRANADIVHADDDRLVLTADHFFPVPASAHEVDTILWCRTIMLVIVLPSPTLSCSLSA